MENGSRGTGVESTELDPTVLIKLGTIETAGYSSVLVEEKSTKSFPFFSLLVCYFHKLKDELKQSHCHVR